MGRACGWRGYRQCLQGNKKLLKASNVAGRSLVGGHTSPLSKPFPPRSSRDPTAPAWDGGATVGATLLLLVLVAAGEAAAVLRDGGYEGLLAAVHPRLPEDGRLLDMITEASLYLFNATRGRVYFRSVKVLIPPTWKDKSYEKPKHETYEKADVIVANPYWNYGDDPYTLQHEACGKMGKYIHFTPNFLVNDYLTDIYGSRALFGALQEAA
uniref:Calcium-activated chloride channel N-terminal domain-containing protein n=1 Tax=Anas platyrhynchos TaxID=8839 RepID=A0A8B9ZBT5_ANAPL